MALKLTIDKLDDVDESFQSLYAEKDGKFVLQVDGLEDTSGLRSALGKERHARSELERKIKRWESLGKNEDEISDLIEKFEKDQQTEAERKGEWDKLRAQMNEKHAAETKKLQDTIAALRSSLEDHLIDANATSAIAAAKGIPDLLLPIIRKNIKVVEDGGKFSVAVVDGKGDLRVNGSGEPMTISEMVMEMRSSEVFGRAFDGTGSSGSGTQPVRLNGGGTPQVQRRSDLKTEKEKAAFVDAHGLAAYTALPS